MSIGFRKLFRLFSPSDTGTNGKISKAGELVSPCFLLCLGSSVAGLGQVKSEILFAELAERSVSLEFLKRLIDGFNKSP